MPKYLRDEGFSFTGPDPIKVDKVQQVFPARIASLMPSQEMVDKYYDREWEKVAEDWFFDTLSSGMKIVPKDGISADVAGNHVGVCLSSWECKHEDKMIGCATLLSMFFKGVIYGANQEA